MSTGIVACSNSRIATGLAFALLGATLFHLGAPRLEAQSGATTGVIRGTIRDPTGDPLPGAIVAIQHWETDLLTRVETSSSGTFVRALLPPGTYELTVTSPIPGFSSERIERLALRVGESLDIAVDLRLVTTETVTVVGELLATLDAADVTSSQRMREDVVYGLPSNGRNFMNMTLLTPGAAISQGPDGDELNISGQRGIFNNFIVDGADFNNPFFGEQRGGQRPAFTFNQDAINELVVVNQGATAEFGRSAGGFVNVITKSGTNELSGTAHYFGQWDEIAAPFPDKRGGVRPEFNRNQVGATLGGPVVRDRAFCFLAYDRQAGAETKQTTRRVNNPANLRRLEDFLQARWPGLFDDEFGPIRRTNDAQALLAKLDLNINDQHQASFKYNYTWSEQVNGTFDVDSWGASANGIEGDRSHAINGSLRSLLTNSLSNELRIQAAREDRPRWYHGPFVPGARSPGPPQFAALGGRPFPDIAMDFADGFRIGLPYFLPIKPAFDTRLQVVENVSFATGTHLLKAGAEYNQTGVEQQFIGFANSRYIFDSVPGFIGFVNHGDSYVTCTDGSASIVGACPPGSSVSGPVLLYLQSATVSGVPAERLGHQQFGVREMGLFVQDSWHPHEHVTLDLGLRWDGTWHPDVFVEPIDTFFAPYLDDPRFPSNGRIPNDLDNLQPRLGMAWDLAGDGRTVLRANAGSYVARIPMLVFAQHRSTNGAFQRTLFRSSAARELGPVPAIERQIDASGTAPFLPDIQVADRDLELPRTWSFRVGAERDVGHGIAASVGYIQARTDNLFQFVNRNDAAFGTPFGIGTHPSGGGINTLTVAESSAKSRYHALTSGLRGRSSVRGRPVTFEVHYTLAFDRSDDDNERDPFTFRYADAANLASEFGWSDRDRRHQVSGYLLTTLGRGTQVSQVIRYLSPSPVSEQCANRGARAAQPTERICADGSILPRNTLRRENEFVTWDIRISRRFALGEHAFVEPVFEVFNLTNSDNFVDPAVGSLLFNFDGSLRSGLGDTRRAQVGLRVQF